MSLSEHQLSASIAVSEMDRAREFYEGALRLTPLREQADGSSIYGSGGGASLHVYESPSSAGRSAGTLATWHVADIEQEVEQLSARGVVFERYDDPALRTDERGIHQLEDGRVAWFKDPDGNTLAIEQ
jgi:catechol 2,3-dioxygenase-like lactoylglutathione lyase family enzyme